MRSRVDSGSILDRLGVASEEISGPSWVFSDFCGPCVVPFETIFGDHVLRPLVEASFLFWDYFLKSFVETIC